MRTQPTDLELEQWAGPSDEASEALTWSEERRKRDHDRSHMSDEDNCKWCDERAFQREMRAAIARARGTNNEEK